MAGIKNIGIYIPMYRLSVEEVGGFWGYSKGRGTKAICGWDEDAITMAVSAGHDCLDDLNEEPKYLILASTTLPYSEKLSASIVSSALGLSSHTTVCDVTNSIRSGTIALKLALTLAAEGDVLIIASDCRVPHPGSLLETITGDGAVSILVTAKDPDVEVEATCSEFTSFFDIWKKQRDTYLRSTEARFIFEEGYLPVLQRVLKNLEERYGYSRKDFEHIVLHGPTNRDVVMAARKLELGREQLSSTLFEEIGNTGVAAPFLQLVNTLEYAKEGSRCLLIAYGDGADAFVFRVNRKRTFDIKKHIRNGVKINYAKYLQWRRLVELAPTTLWERPKPSLQTRWRERKTIYLLAGYKCERCGRIQIHPQGQRVRVCVYCQSKDCFSDYPLCVKKGSLFTYTIDHLQFTLNPPGVNGVVDFEDGGRLLCELTDCKPEELKVGMPVKMSFRVLDEGEIVNYFWKAKPDKGN